MSAPRVLQVVLSLAPGGTERLVRRASWLALRVYVRFSAVPCIFLRRDGPAGLAAAYLHVGDLLAILEMPRHMVPWPPPCESSQVFSPGGLLRARHYDDEWTIESWRLEPRVRPLDVTDREGDPAPPLWKDLTLASIVAALLWGTAALMFS